MKLKKRDITKSKTEANMKRLFRRNQIIITTLAIMIAAAGYLNYAGKEELGCLLYTSQKRFPEPLLPKSVKDVRWTPQ